VKDSLLVCPSDPAYLAQLLNSFGDSAPGCFQVHGSLLILSAPKVGLFCSESDYWLGPSVDSSCVSAVKTAALLYESHQLIAIFTTINNHSNDSL
jgi:hypothetical protein